MPTRQKTDGPRKGGSSNNNLVAKYARRFNRSVVFKDKKRAIKRGETKHKHQAHQIAA